jgi:anti-sigma regulatory factor (Ser/Thr protein kinase)
MTLATWQKYQANLGDLGVLRQFVNQQALARGLDDAGTYDLALAVTEVVTNILVHGYAGQPGPVMVLVERVEDVVVVQIRDQAPPFDPLTIPSPTLTTPLERRSPGGMGFHLVQSSVDEVLYEELPDGGNLLKLLKHLSGGQREHQDNG